MRFIFALTRYPGIGGIEVVTRTIASRMIQGYSLDILSFFQEGEMDIPNVGLFQMPEKKYDSCSNRAFVKKILMESKYDALIYQDSYAPTEKCVIESAKQCGVPVLVFEHNTPRFVESKRNMEKWYKPMGLARRVLHPWLMYKERRRKRYLLENCFRYVVLSEAFVDDFCNVIGSKKSDYRLRVVHNPVISCVFSGLEIKQNVILCVAQLNSVKRVNLMLKAWCRISYDLPNWCFWIVGDGPERSKLEKLAKDLKLQRVRFWGFQKSAKFYEKAKVFWMTSKYEGWGLTLVEAMQRGCIPVAMNTYASLKDIVDSGKNGMICQADDLDAFCKATLAIAQDDNAYKKMIVNARQKTHNWEIENVLKEWYSLLGELTMD